MPCFFSSLRANARKGGKNKAGFALSFLRAPLGAMSCFFVSDSEQKPPIPWGIKQDRKNLGKAKPITATSDCKNVKGVGGVVGVCFWVWWWLSPSGLGVVFLLCFFVLFSCFLFSKAVK